MTKACTAEANRLIRRNTAIVLDVMISGESKSESESYSGERIRRERGEDRDIKSKELDDASMQMRCIYHDWRKVAPGCELAMSCEQCCIQLFPK
eukprot:scaffold25812_cov66-Skeletonema_marinoi.AAC.1